MEEFQKQGKGIAIPTYRGTRGHPIIFAMKYREKLLALKGDVGGRQIVSEHPDDVLEVPVDAEGVTIDIDTMRDYESCISSGQFSPGP